MSATLACEVTTPHKVWEETDHYRFFAHVLATPTHDRYTLLHSAEFSESLRQLWRELACEGEFPELGRFRNFAAYESAYIALFDVGVPEPPVPLAESGHYKAVPAQQTAFENVLFYEVLGLRMNPGRSFADHLQTQLEFLAAARYVGDHSRDIEDCANAQRLERDFLQRHLLNWLPLAEKKLRRLDPPVFVALFCLLLAFLRNRLQALSCCA